MDERKRKTYGNGERYFLRKLRILTEFLRINVILRIFETEHGDTDTDERKRNNTAGNQVQVSVTNRSREFYTDISAAVFPFLDHPALNALRCKGFLKIK